MLQFGKKPKMQVDTDPLKVDEALYSKPLDCMMVEATEGLDKEVIIIGDIKGMMVGTNSKLVIAARCVERTQPVEVVKLGEAAVQKEFYPRSRLTEKERITANQILAMKVSPLEEEDPDYESLPEDDMVDDDYGEDFIIDCAIMSILPAKYDRVSEEDHLPTGELWWLFDGDEYARNLESLDIESSVDNDKEGVVVDEASGRTHDGRQEVQQGSRFVVHKCSVLELVKLDNKA
ncbi:unnamed protein product [Vicia faba]|uniref:Uncharacterized protein n=1 Tax=Vicia faba TaxID=3906 RepID=A0AAV0ZIW7_VICFA|nr:unnamed protein product [Vicia faba]